MKRPDPETFAAYSYYLAFASSIILTLTFILGLIPVPALQTLRQIIWLVLFTSAIGAFLGYAANADFKRRRREPDEQAVRQARVGFRINLVALIVMLLILILVIVINTSPLVSG